MLYSMTEIIVYNKVATPDAYLLIQFSQYWIIFSPAWLQVTSFLLL